MEIHVFETYCIFVTLYEGFVEKELKGEASCSSCDSMSLSNGEMKLSVGSTSHPDHSAIKKRLNRIKGQLDAVSRMVDEREYCPNIIQQIRAATSALRGIEAEVMKSHLRGCVKDAFESKDSTEVNTKIDEILRLWSK
jgi:DNA-binding FrmR family transcriptional regulator